MRLRHVLLLASGVGAAGALLLAADIHRRVQEAQRDVAINTTTSGSDSVIQFGDAHTLGLLALAFIFIAMFLMVVSEPLRQKAIDAAAAAARKQEAIRAAEVIALAHPAPPEPETAPLAESPPVVIPAAPIPEVQAAPENANAATPAVPVATETKGVSETKETPTNPDAM